MNPTLKYLRLLFLSLSGMFILCIPFAANDAFANGMVMGKVCWFHTAMAFWAGSVCFVELTLPKRRFIFTWPDGFLLLYIAAVLLTYQWKLNPEPEKLLFAGQLVMLWFMLRTILKEYPPLQLFFISILMGSGMMEAVWGLSQLYGFSSSNHSLFRLTGTFFNPGPFSGYLAIILPVCLGMILKLWNCDKKTWWRSSTLLYYIACACAVLILMVLPAGMSRSAWIAAAVSCGWVYWKYRIGWKKAKRLWTQHSKIGWLIAMSAVVVLFVGLIGIYNIKKDSAHGRLLMWSMTAKAIGEQPVTGVGLGGFPAAFAQEQANYFGSGSASDVEKLIAGCPEYAFNEYLQIGLEQGVIGLSLFMLWLGFSFYYGTKKRLYGASGGILALAVFAISSYPFQLPSFWVILMFLTAICVTRPGGRQEEEKSRITLPYVGLIAALGCFILFWLQIGTSDIYKQWNYNKMFYNNKSYDIAIKGYKTLYPHLKHKPEFLFEGAQCLSKTNQPAEANVWLQRAVQLSADPMLYYVMARNEQTLGQYEASEKHLLYAISILPERLYPYFLLTKLYAEPAFHQPEKMQDAARAVLTKEPKVKSTAIREMRQEVEKMLNNIHKKNR